MLHYEVVKNFYRLEICWFHLSILFFLTLNSCRKQNLCLWQWNSTEKLVQKFPKISSVQSLGRTLVPLVPAGLREPTLKDPLIFDYFTPPKLWNILRRGRASCTAPSSSSWQISWEEQALWRAWSSLVEPLGSAMKIKPVLQTRDLRAWTNDEVSSTSLLGSTQYRCHSHL